MPLCRASQPTLKGAVPARLPLIHSMIHSPIVAHFPCLVRPKPPSGRPQAHIHRHPHVISDITVFGILGSIALLPRASRPRGAPSIAPPNAISCLCSRYGYAPPRRAPALGRHCPRGVTVPRAVQRAEAMLSLQGSEERPLPTYARVEHARDPDVILTLSPPARHTAHAARHTGGRPVERARSEARNTAWEREISARAGSPRGRASYSSTGLEEGGGLDPPRRRRRR